MLDVVSTVTPGYTELKELAIFLTQPGNLSPDAALALYVSIGEQLGRAAATPLPSTPNLTVPLSLPCPAAV